jgi:hypothetical protein
MFKVQVKKIGIYTFIPILLISLSFILTYIYFFNFDTNPNTITTHHPSSDIKIGKDSISVRFTAQEDYLRSFTLQFDTQNRPYYYNESLYIGIRDISKVDWYHDATFAASLANVSNLYPFAIPIIKKSRGKIYEVKLHPLNETYNLKRRVKISSPQFATNYVFPTNLFAEDRQNQLAFFIGKFKNYSSEKNFYSVLTLYSMPFLIYTIFLLSKKYIKRTRCFIRTQKTLFDLSRPYIVFLLIKVFIDIYITFKYSLPFTITYLILWLFGTIAYRLSSRYSFTIALILLTNVPFLLLANMNWIAEKSIIWAYMFLLVGAIQFLMGQPSPLAYVMDTNITHGKKATILDVYFRFRNLIVLIMKIIILLILVIDKLVIDFLKKVWIFAFFSYRNFIKIIFACIAFIVVCYFGLYVYLKVINYRDRQLKNPAVTIVEPTMVYPGTKIIFYGDRFGDGNNDKYALVKDGIKIRPDYWEDHKIIFTVPLDWKKPGVMNLWIEKPIIWNSTTIIEKTKPVQIHLLQVTGDFTPDDDLYFEQMKSWRKETKDINGY